MASGPQAVGEPSRTLVALMRFLDLLDEHRHGAWRARYGRKVHFRETTRAVIRKVILGYVEGRPLTVADAKRELKELASAYVIATDVRLLSDLGLVSARQERDGSRMRTMLLPTKTLVDWLEAELMGGFRRLIVSMEDWVALSDGMERPAPVTGAVTCRTPHGKPRSAIQPKPAAGRR